MRDADALPHSYLATLRAHLDQRVVRIGLGKAKIVVAPGLTEEECQAIQRRFDFTFPPDLRRLLCFMLPTGAGFPDWRSEPDESLRRRLDWPLDGICFDIERDNFWVPAWGQRPADLAEALTIAREQVRQAPRLIPVYSHRFLPADPPAAGNPVFSVWQTDIIRYGETLTGYIAREFGVVAPAAASSSPRIPFWDDLAQ